MGQFHSKDKKYGDERNPPWMFFNTSRENIGGYWINNMVRVPAGYSTQLLTREEAYGKWNDILINIIMFLILISFSFQPHASANFAASRVIELT